MVETKDNGANMGKPSIHSIFLGQNHGLHGSQQDPVSQHFFPSYPKCSPQTIVKYHVKYPIEMARNNGVNHQQYYHVYGIFQQNGSTMVKYNGKPSINNITIISPVLSYEKKLQISTSTPFTLTMRSLLLDLGTWCHGSPKRKKSKWLEKRSSYGK